MTPSRRTFLLAAGAAVLQWSTATRGGHAAAAEGDVTVALLTYGNGEGARCFASHFLGDVARRTQVKLRRDFQSVPIDGDTLHEFPFAVLTGEGPFTLSETERQRLKVYLERGGFLLASAGCSNAQWAQSFRDTAQRMFPDVPLTKLPADHALFRTLYQIDGLEMRKGGANQGLFGLFLGDRLAVVFSPEGLNDTAHAGGGCCCCGGNEVRNAPQVNANILLYALTH